MWCYMAPTEVKNRISEGCFFAVGSYAQYKLEKVHQEDDNGVDYRLIKNIERNGRIYDAGSVLEFQIKSTKNWSDDGQNIKYSLESKTYNDIVSRNKIGGVRLILVIMCLPEQQEEWVGFFDDKIEFKNNLYWFYTDSDELLESEKSKKTISVPKVNVLDRAGFVNLVNKFSLQKRDGNGIN